MYEQYRFPVGIGRTEQMKQKSTDTKKLLSETDSSLTRDPPGARTQDPNIKSVVLYQLS